MIQNVNYLACVDPAYKRPPSTSWNLPIYHPFHFISVVMFFCFLILVSITSVPITSELGIEVPIGYHKIYQFRKNQDSRIRGISDGALRTRKKKNLVSTKFNIMIWLVEAVACFIVLIPGLFRIRFQLSKIIYCVGSHLSFIAYFLFPNTVSPMLYFIGMESNRNTLKDKVTEIIKESKGARLTNQVREGAE